MSGLLAIMGLGETAPTMVSIHRTLAARLSADASAVLLETPYGFQENVADISARACQYFARSVGLTVTTAPGLRGTDDPDHTGRGLAMLRTADWLFSGPGSPTYAMRSWSATPVGHALHDRIRRRHGITVFASAAAATLGRWVVPVYEIYKVGAAPHWLGGLDLLHHLDLHAAVIPHYDNAEGGTHDTRHCYPGERRLHLMEQQLPDDASILGIDEHTAALIDPATDTVQVIGRGTMTVRRHGTSTVLPAGLTLTLTELRRLAHGHAVTTVIPRQTPTPAADTAPATVTEVAADCEQRFNDAHARRDAPAMTQAVLDLETTIHDWSTDTEEDDGADQARAILRTLILRLGNIAATGVDDPTARLRPTVQPLLDLREPLRANHDYPTADAVRDALTAAGIALHDSPDGVRWSTRLDQP